MAYTICLFLFIIMNAISLIHTFASLDMFKFCKDLGNSVQDQIDVLEKALEGCGKM